MFAPDALSIVEMAYDLSGSEEAWLARIGHAVAGRFSGDNVVAFSFDVSNCSAMSLFNFCTVRGDPNSHIIADGLARLPPDIVRKLYRGKICSTTSQVLGAEHGQWLAATRSAWGVEDVLGIVATNPNGCGVTVGIGLSEIHAPSPRMVSTWSKIAAHLAAGFRLRRQLEATGTRDPEAADAIFDERGGCLHVNDEAALAPNAQLALKKAITDIEHARGGEVRRDPERALELWRGLLEGRWSLIESIDSGGRRHWVLHENKPKSHDPRALTDNERAVLNQAATGRSQKYIAYELGIPSSTVATRLKSGMRKLQLDSQTELVAWFSRRWESGQSDG